MTNYSDDTIRGKLRRGAIRIGLEVLQGLNAGDVSQPSEEDIPANIEEYLNNPYVNRKGIPLAMDIFKPVGEEYDGKELPVIVTIHGGGLITGDRKISLNLSRHLASRGYLVFAIEYRLAPRASVSEQFDDICAGMDLVGEKLLDYDVDYTRIFLTADSAGAFLAIYTAAMKKSKKLQDAIGYQPSRMIFRAIGLSCGMFYTNRDDILGGLLSEQFYGDKKDDSNFLQYMNPEHPEIINNLPPTFLVTSRGDFLNQYTIMFEKALKKAGRTTKMLYYSEEELMHTFNFAHPDYPQSQDANDKMLNFFEEQARIQYMKNKDSKEQLRKKKAIERKIENGSLQSQRLYKVVREINCLTEENLDTLALIDDSRGFTYRQLFRKWDQYAEVFSALRMTGRSGSKTGIPGAMTKEAIFAFYGLNMTGAVISLLPCSYAKKAEQLMDAIRKEELTDLILTDFETSPAFLKELLKEKENLGLRHIIILQSEVSRPGANKVEIRKFKENTALLKKTTGVLFMNDLLVQYEASPITYGKVGNGTVILHKKTEEDSSCIGVEYSDIQLNAAVLDRADKFDERMSSKRVGLSADLSSPSVLLDQVQLSLYTGNCIVIVHKTGYNPSFLKLAGEKYVNSLYLYQSQIDRMRDSLNGKKINAASFNEIFLLEDSIEEAKADQNSKFFKKNGGNPSFSLYACKDMGYSDESLFMENNKKTDSVAAAVRTPDLFFRPSVPSVMMPPLPYAPAFVPADMNRKRQQGSNPLIWVDNNGNKHDMLNIFQKLLPALGSAAQNIGKPETDNEALQGDAAKVGLMKILGVLFEPSDTDYYYED